MPMIYHYMLIKTKKLGFWDGSRNK